MANERKQLIYYLLVKVKYMVMSLSLDEYRAKLINHILFASSQGEVNQFIEAAMKALEQNKINGHIIARFVDKIISDLDLFDPMKKDAQHWSNIKMAKILFNRIKPKMKALSD
jgi:hypothetical protein